ncbi:RNA-binding protein 41 isoform X2 [Amia ocellicauda]|uniref:RNA-binding protein 41 isoform X2 n=1 Tax=Amia ocellicauda TaxID=2972642 RepID=UPI00346415C6
MRRVSRRPCEDAPAPEEQETEGQRQLHSLLLQQLDTDTDIERCLAKKKCFGPAALYLPFGEQAAGVRSLSQFRALQEGEQEVASLRELGLSDTEIQLWRHRNVPEAGEKPRGVWAAPGVMEQRMRELEEKVAWRRALLLRPQRFSASRPLSRRQMEIEKALFRGSDRHCFLSALYHQESQPVQDGVVGSDPLDSLYQDVLSQGGPETPSIPADAEGSDSSQPSQSQNLSKHSSESQGGSSSSSSYNQSNIDLKSSSQSQSGSRNPSQTQIESRNFDQSKSHSVQSQNETSSIFSQSQDKSNIIHQSQSQSRETSAGLSVPQSLSASQPIGRLCSIGTGPPLTVTGPVQPITEHEIRGNRATVQEIRQIPRFQNYQQGEPSKVLFVRNLSPRATLAQLVSVFSLFQPPTTPPLLYRLLTGRLKGQAFITFPDRATAADALELVNGFRLTGRPLVIEFGRERESGREGERRREHGAAPTTSCTGTEAPSQRETDGQTDRWG